MRRGNMLYNGAANQIHSLVLFSANLSLGTFGDDEPDNFDINCFSQLEFKDSYSSLTCNFIELPPDNTNYTLALW